MLIGERLIPLFILLIVALFYLGYRFNEAVKENKAYLKVGYYFKQSKEIIVQEKWLIVFPVVSALLSSLINFSFLILRFDSELFFSSNPRASLFQLRDFMTYLSDLFTTPIRFSLFYYGNLINQIIFIILTVIFLIVVKFSYNELINYINRDNKQEFFFFKTTINYSFYILIITLITLLFAIITDFNLLEDPVFMQVIYLMIYFMPIIFFSLLIGIILTIIKGRYKGENYSLKYSLNKTLKSYKELLKLSTTLFIILNVEQIFYFIPSLGQQLIDYQSIIEGLKVIVVLFTLFTYHTILFHEKDFKSGLEENIRFIKLNLLKYIKLIILFTFSYFLFSALLQAINLARYGEVYNQILNIIYLLGQSSILVFFSIIITLFFLKNKTNMINLKKVKK